MKCENDGFMKKPPFSDQRGRGGKVLLLFLILALIACAVIGALALARHMDGEVSDPGYVKQEQRSTHYDHETGRLQLIFHWENVSADKTLYWDGQSCLQYFNGRRWVECKKIAEAVIDDTEYVLAPGEVLEQTLDVSHYDFFSDVPYRVAAQYRDDRSARKAYTVYTEIKLGADILDFFEGAAPLTVDGKQSRREMVYHFFGEGTFTTKNGLSGADGQSLSLKKIYSKDQPSLSLLLFDSADYLVPLKQNARNHAWRCVINSYGESFFRDNVLLDVRFKTGSGSHQYKVDSLTIEGGVLYIDVSLIPPDGDVTADMASVSLLIELEREAFEKCSNYEVRITHN